MALGDVNSPSYSTPSPLLRARLIADGQVKAGAGFVHTISIGGLIAAPTAGLLTVYDSLTETGPVIFAAWIAAGILPVTIVLDEAFSTGLYIGFDATLANVNVNVSYS